jgi:threonine aldolase
MYSFRNDYSEGAHELVLEALLLTNREQTAGYGEDKYTEQAKEVIRREIGREDADIHFIPGGTQTNLLAVSSFLKSYEAVICADTGHINVHETGAIEATGHKVVTAKTPDGKLTTEMIQGILDGHATEHMVKPGMVYISDSTELGTIYSKNELKALSDYCKEKELLLFLDGARLGSALTSLKNDLTLPELAALVDCFYIGGTKNGALFGEALVILKEELKKDFRFYIKQRGALFAKGRILGIQFLTLFTEGLFFEIGYHANKMAQKIREGMEELGYQFYSESYTNQLFPIVNNKIIEELEKEYEFELQHQVDEEHSCIRFVTSWATTTESVNYFIRYLREIENRNKK